MMNDRGAPTGRVRFSSDHRDHRGAAGLSIPEEKGDVKHERRNARELKRFSRAYACASSCVQSDN